MTPARRAVAVVVHYGDHQRTIRSVLGHWHNKVFSRIIVVANDQSERPAELTDDICTWVIPRRNLGFGAGCQFAAAACFADIYAFFNAHVTMDGASVRRCVAAFDIPDVGITAPMVHLPVTGNPQKDWENTYCIRTYSSILRRPIRVPLRQSKRHRIVTDGTGTDDIQSTGGVIDNEWATGCAIFCRGEIIRDIGWDGSYFLTYEDADISMRTSRSGWRVVTVPTALAYHTGESTRPRALSTYYGVRNSIWFFRKYQSRPRQILLTFYLLLVLPRIATADAVRKRRPRHAPSAAYGIVDGWALSPSGKDPLPGEPLRFPKAHSRIPDRGKRP
jgi:N-acetylglucosaminyl-diphospho-decaprenol L-rhamnosyltransferase